MFRSFAKEINKYILKKECNILRLRLRLQKNAERCVLFFNIYI